MVSGSIDNSIFTLQPYLQRIGLKEIKYDLGKNEEGSINIIEKPKKAYEE